MSGSQQFPVMRVLVLMALSANAQAAVQGPPGSGMLGTMHDFSGEGYLVPVSGLQVGICSICHTPHSAITTSLLWNQKLTTATYTWGDASETHGGTPLPSSAHLGPSTKCLSCHDGSVAVGDTAVYYGMIGGKGAPGDTWDMGTLTVRLGAGGYGVGHVPSGSTVGDMSGNHPIAIPYPLNNSVGTYNNVRTGSRVDLTEFVSNPNAPSHGIKLYTDDGTGKVSPGTAAGITGIECTSCHDPHNKATVDTPFLRGMNTGSTVGSGYLCLQCHIK